MVLLNPGLLQDELSASFIEDAIGERDLQLRYKQVLTTDRE
jgi:hypothetical protein